MGMKILKEDTVETMEVSRSIKKPTSVMDIIVMRSFAPPRYWLCPTGGKAVGSIF